jgi:hypothetical protein
MFISLQKKRRNKLILKRLSEYKCRRLSGKSKWRPLGCAAQAASTAVPVVVSWHPGVSIGSKVGIHAWGIQKF